jgi:hypothetical protein
MESMPDLLHLLVQALALVAASLDQWFPVPWALPIAVLFVPFVAALDVMVWYLRGMVFPIPCGYPTVRQGLCSRQALGEWHRCWYLQKSDQGTLGQLEITWHTRPLSSH